MKDFFDLINYLIDLVINYSSNISSLNLHYKKY